MEQEKSQIDPTEKFQEVTREYLAGARRCISDVEQRIAKAAEVLDMKNPIHAESMGHQVRMALFGSRTEFEKLAQEYREQVRALEYMVK